MTQVRIQGASLAGMAAAARLARLGHHVQLGRNGITPGGAWAPHHGPQGHLVDAQPQVILLPALWRDLFTKTGRPLAGSVGLAGLELLKAPAAIHRFADGSEFTFPTERGAQYHAIRAHFGERAAAQWRDLLDDLGEIWRAWRRYGVESLEIPHTKQARAALGLNRTVRDLAERLDDSRLQAVVYSHSLRSGTDSLKAPALNAVTLLLERTFDRWQLLDGESRTAAPSALIGILEQRLAQRGVESTDTVSDPDIDALPRLPKKKLGRPAPRPALAPQVHHSFHECTPISGVQEVVDHSSRALRITWDRWVGDGVVRTEHDWSQPTADIAYGIAPDDSSRWLQRIPILGSPLRISTCSPAGNAPWSELAAGALATYQLHLQLTGQDSSPTNKAFTPPPLKRASWPSTSR